MEAAATQVITTTQADAQLDLLTEEDRDRALQLITKIIRKGPRFTKATRMAPAPFGEGWLWKFRTGNVRVLIVVEGDNELLTVVGFGLRQAAA